MCRWDEPEEEADAEEVTSFKHCYLEFAAQLGPKFHTFTGLLSLTAHADMIQGHACVMQQKDRPAVLTRQLAHVSVGSMLQLAAVSAHALRHSGWHAPK